MTTTAKLLTRKDIATFLGPEFSPRRIGRNEKRWGLDKARVEMFTPRVFYREAQAMRILLAQGVGE